MKHGAISVDASLTNHFLHPVRILLQWIMWRHDHQEVHCLMMTIYTWFIGYVIRASQICHWMFIDTGRQGLSNIQGSGESCGKHQECDENHT